VQWFYAGAAFSCVRPGRAFLIGADGRRRFRRSACGAAVAKGLSSAPFGGAGSAYGVVDRLFYQINSTIVPATIMPSPIADLTVSLSPNATRAKAMETRMLSLSIGTTTLAGPVCSAR
jgi:hypothetical protein